LAFFADFCVPSTPGCLGDERRDFLMLFAFSPAKFPTNSLSLFPSLAIFPPFFFLGLTPWTPAVQALRRAFAP